MNKASLFLAAIGALLIMSMAGEARARSCDPAMTQELASRTATVLLTCDLALAPDMRVQAPLLLSGSAASGTTLDCHGATIAASRSDQVAITIASARGSDGSFDPPSRITIRDCHILGAIHIMGMGINAEADAVRQSSLQEGHTARAQAAAPSEITLDRLSIETEGAIALYVGPGTTGLTLSNSTLSGTSASVAVYLDAETSHIRLEKNDFQVKTSKREMIAVDGSAHDQIIDNRFLNADNGGIFLYRNCGEGGTIRHQAPQDNTIAGNSFVYRETGLMAWWRTKPAVWLGSRQGHRPYCFQDPRYPFGSSLNSADEAQHNRVTGNTVEGGSTALIVDSDKNNQVSGNVSR